MWERSVNKNRVREIMTLCMGLAEAEKRWKYGFNLQGEQEVPPFVLNMLQFLIAWATIIIITSQDLLSADDYIWCLKCFLLWPSQLSYQVGPVIINEALVSKLWEIICSSSQSKSECPDLHSYLQMAFTAMGYGKCDVWCRRVILLCFIWLGSCSQLLFHFL